MLVRPSSSLPDITHLVLGRYLGLITGITDWTQFSPNLGIPVINGVYAIVSNASIGGNTIVVDDGDGAAPEPLEVGYDFTIAGSSTVHTIAGVVVGANSHTYTILPVLDQNVEAGDLLTIATPSRYAGCIWPYRYLAETIALRQPTTFSIVWGIRLLIATPDASLTSLRATQWARILDRVLESASTLQGQSVYGLSLAGTYGGVVVPSGTTIALGQRAEWNIRIEENDSGGAVASIQSSFTVIN